MRATSYADAGVDIDAQEAAIGLFRDAVRSTYTSSVVHDLGGFGGLFALDREAVQQPVLVGSIDSVGTKVILADLAGRHHGIGQDIVNHCVNDIGVMGAEPLFFLDYIGIPHLRPEHIAELVDGIATACRAVGCALIGGELAELPGVYRQGTYDLVGAVVGLVDRAAVPDPSRIEPGDLVIGLPSSGLHTNGYSLARRVLLEQAGLPLEEEIPALGCTLADALLAVHRCYLPVLRAVRGGGVMKAAAHITGGGLVDNPPRVLPDGCGLRLDRRTWHVPPIFGLIAELGGVPDEEMQRTFNLGLGMLLIVGKDDAEAALARCAAAGCGGMVVGVVQGGEGVEMIGRDETRTGGSHG